MQSRLRLLGVVLVLSVILFFTCLRFSAIPSLRGFSCPQTVHIEYRAEVVSESTSERLYSYHPDTN